MPQSDTLENPAEEFGGSFVEQGDGAKHVHFFGAGAAPVEPDEALLGGKGANLCEMAQIGLPVPPGFVIDTFACSIVHHGEALPEWLKAQVAEGLSNLEQSTGKTFGSGPNPLLVSVRSGAPVSMPGMMDTVLNLGLNDETVGSLAEASGDERFAWDSYRRFIQMYSDVVLGLELAPFEAALETARVGCGAESDQEIPAVRLRQLSDEFEQIVFKASGRPFPQKVDEQLERTIEAVFESWNTPRARAYRRLNRVSDESGTAVTVQAMVFGNLGETSATGVVFTRDPATGERKLYGEYLANAQGEDVVAGVRTPLPLIRGDDAAGRSLQEAMPDSFARLSEVLERLERHYRDAQDVEFTIERGSLFILQTRSAKRSANAAAKIAVDFVSEGLISREEALLRVDAGCADQLLHPRVDPAAPRTQIAVGLAASPGAASGRIVFSSARAQEQSRDGPVILVRNETSPDDIEGMYASAGFLTATGGLTSHAAVVARGMGRPCVCGADALQIEESGKLLAVGEHVLREGDTLTIDGSSGAILLGQVALLPAAPDRNFDTLLQWADSVRRLRVRANADTAADCRRAIEFGAEGIGLCRTEHMFFGEARLAAVQEMILAADAAGRERALAQLAAAQRSDFIDIFDAVEGRPVTVRLLDPPLHEFLPKSEKEFALLARKSGIDANLLKDRAAALHEFNPMLGHRGCRLGITHPEIYEMQCRAIFEAAVAVLLEGRAAPAIEVMVPLVCSREELALIREMIDRVAREVLRAAGVSLDYLVGTMIELPRAALVAGEIATIADFFSFGTNDLTQTTLGLSRDDSHRFLETYGAHGIFARDPFVSIDAPAVGRLMAIAVESGRASAPTLKLGICGEHGGDPESIDLCERLGLDYVSASPYRALTARLAAAQAALRHAKRPAVLTQ